MPIYEYECSGCSCRFELKQSFGEDSPVSCPQCGSKARRLFSLVPVIFKGTGFYATDSRGNHNQPADEKSTDQTKPGNTDQAKTGSAEKGA